MKLIQSRLTRVAQWTRKVSILKRVLVGAPSLFLVVILWSVSTALLAPGTDPVTARLAEWGRNHYLGSVITSLENLQYTFSKPKVGGALDSATAKQLAADAIHYVEKIPSIVIPALPGEGDLKTVYKVNGKAAIQVGFLRPDQQHTSYLTGVAIMQSSLLRFVQHAGFSEPGKLAKLKSTDVLKGADLVGLAATFNSAFKIKDSLGGYYQNGVLVKPLVAGKATFVIYSDGHADVGLWGTEVSMNPTVVSVRQNLSMLIDNGAVAHNLNESVLQKWGWTVKNAHLVWRSGVGVDLNGNIIYVAGNALSVQSLADVLKAAGAVRAMEFDINPYWISYMWYPTTTDGVMKAPMKLVPFTRQAERYFSQSSRDFFAVYAR